MDFLRLLSLTDRSTKCRPEPTLQIPDNLTFQP
jgi:hypothetical protein